MNEGTYYQVRQPEFSPQRPHCGRGKLIPTSVLCLPRTRFTLLINQSIH